METNTRKQWVHAPQHSHQGHPTPIETAETSRQGLGMTKPQITNKMKLNEGASSSIFSWQTKNTAIATCVGQTKMQPTRSGVIILPTPTMHC